MGLDGNVCAVKEGGEVWAWCSGGCARWYYLDEGGQATCPVCLSLPTAYTAENPRDLEPATIGETSEAQQMFAHCPQCGQWFLVVDASLDTSFLCPRCLVPADDTRWQDQA